MKISVFDIDGTLFRGFFIVNFPVMLCERDAFIPMENKRIQDIYNSYKDHKPFEGKLLEYDEFAWELVNAFGKGIKNQSIEKIMGLGREYVAQNSLGFSFARDLVKLVKKKGYRPIAVSGSPYEVILPFAEIIGMDETYATSYKHSNGVFTGEVEQNCAIAMGKKVIIDRYLTEHRVDIDASAGFGDSYHDLPFLELVGYAVAIKPDSKLEEAVNRQTEQKTSVG